MRPAGSKLQNKMSYVSAAASRIEAGTTLPYYNLNNPAPPRLAPKRGGEDICLELGILKNNQDPKHSRGHDSIVGLKKQI